jgi:hypothetical protein
MLDGIRQKIESRGWEVVEVRNIRYLWVAEIWKVSSKWSPRNLVLYLSFQVDPEDGPREFEKIRWLHASSSPPVDWALDSEDREKQETAPGLEYHSTVIGRNQDRYFDKFLDGLDAWRDAATKSGQN